MSAAYPAFQGPAFQDAKLIREVFWEAAALLRKVRDAWKVGDERMADLLSHGWGPETGGYEQVIRHGERIPIQSSISTIREELLPYILPHADTSLRDRIMRVIQMVELDEWSSDIYGREGMRWRQAWPATGLEPEFEQLIPMLEAKGDELLIASRTKPPASDPASGQARGRAEAANKKALPPLGPHAMKAWQLSQVSGLKQREIADALNKEFGTSYKQPAVSRMIKQAMQHAEASGLAALAEGVGKKADRERAVDPRRLELGPRNPSKPSTDEDHDEEEGEDTEGESFEST